MRIERLKTRIVSLPLERPVRTPIHDIAEVDNVLVEIETDEGCTGIAYIWCFGRHKARALEALVHDHFSHVQGMGALERERVGAVLWNQSNFLGRSGAVWIAASAIDTALWDIAGKMAGRPLWQMLGGSDAPIRAYAGGFFLSDSIEALREEAVRRVAEGFAALKMRCGAPNWREDIARVAAVRETVGPDVEILIDAVQGWNVWRALKLGRALAEYDIVCIEDPVAFDDLEGMARLRRDLDVPITAGENTYGREGFRRLFEAGAVDIAMIDLQRAGGISEWMKIAAMAEAQRVPVVPHVFHEISVHLLAATPGAPYVECMSWWEPLFVDELRPSAGVLAPPDRPGLGLTFDEDAIEPHIVRPT